MDEIGAGNAAQSAHADPPAGRAAMPDASRFWAIRDVTPCTGRPPSWAAKCLLDFSAGSVLLAQQGDHIARPSREFRCWDFIRGCVSHTAKLCRLLPIVGNSNLDKAPIPFHYPHI